MRCICLTDPHIVCWLNYIYKRRVTCLHWKSVAGKRESMKLYGYVLERGKDKMFRKEVFDSNKMNGVYYLDRTPKWLCKHYVYDFEIGRAVSAVADYVFLLEDDEPRAQMLLIEYYLKEITELKKQIEKYVTKKEKVENGTDADANH